MEREEEQKYGQSCARKKGSGGVRGLGETSTSSITNSCPSTGLPIYSNLA